MSDNPIFRIAERAAELRAAGVDVVTLAAGEPEAATAMHVVHAAVDAASDPTAHHYGTAQGEPALREAVAAQLQAQTAQVWSPSDVQITLGAKHALHLAILALTHRDDEVLIASPGWPGHAAAAEAAGVVPVLVRTDREYRLTPAMLETARTTRTRAVILSSPGNPTGAVYDRQHLQQIAAWAKAHDIWLISDDLYAAFDYTGTHCPVLAAAPDYRERIVIVGSVSKEHAMTGWRIGWLAAPETVITTARRHVAQTITNVPVITQRGALAAVQDTDAPRQAAEAYRRRRDRLVQALQQVDGINVPAPDGGMFVFIDARDLLTRNGISSTTELAEWLLEHARVAVVPGEAFHAPGHLRLCFAVSDHTLDTAIERLTTALEDLADPRVARKGALQ